jgi:hypothetical protein
MVFFSAIVRARPPVDFSPMITVFFDDATALFPAAIKDLRGIIILDATPFMG